MLEQPLITALGQDIIAIADSPVTNYKDHLNKVARVQFELSNLLGVKLDNPQLRGTAELLCGGWSDG